VSIEFDALPAVHSIDDALAAKTVVWGTDNVFKSFLVARGDVEAAFAGGHEHGHRGEYETGAQEQLYIEPQGIIAQVTPDGGITVRGSCSVRTTCTPRL
jgi:xanthine dehydrogenase molybdopterin-binding subunit B